MRRASMRRMGQRGTGTGRRTSTRWRAGATVAGVVLAGSALGAAGAAAGSDTIIRVAQVPATVELGPCSPGSTGLSYETIDTATSFTLRISSVRPPCAPITAVAAVYRMPDGAMAWPQRLVERREIVIDRAGTTDVRFAKGCEPLQFDVVRGATPEEIAPWAAWHGPLLFPGDTNTALQYRPGVDCAGPTSTVAPTTAPSTTAPPSTTPGPTTTSPIAAPTTASPTTASPSTTVPASVLGETQTPTTDPDRPDRPDDAAGTTAAPQVAGLAITGTSVRVMVIGSLVTILVGLCLLAAQRRGRLGA